MQNSGEIDSFVTDYSLPKIKKKKTEAPKAHFDIRRYSEPYQRLSLDALKIDVMVIKKRQVNGKTEYTYLPIQTKLRRQNSRKGIFLEQSEAASLRRSFPELRSCFNNLKNKYQHLRVKSNCLLIRTLKSKNNETFKTKDDLKKEIRQAFTDENKTFKEVKKIKDFATVDFLIKLFQEKLLEGQPQQNH